MDSVFRDFASHHVPENSLIFKVIKPARLHDVPSWNKEQRSPQHLDKYACEKGDLISNIIWLSLNRRTSKIKRELKEEDIRIKSWNKRVDETKLIKKLGSPKKWNLINEHKDADEAVGFKIPVPEPAIDSRSEVVVEIPAKPENTQAMDAHNSDLIDPFEDSSGSDIAENDNDSVSEQKKRSHFFRPLTKLFKSGKSHKGKGSSTKGKEKLNNASLKQVKNIFEEKNTRGLVGSGQRISDSAGTSICRRTGNGDNGSVVKRCDPEAESLAIQVPGNIGRIILIKDGRRIALEI